MDKFPENFVFGTATAAYQIEGAAWEDGRSASIWDTFSRKDGNVFMGHTGDVACDHYHRYKDDIKLMKEVGLDSYRFSIAWPRIFPEKGRFNQKGIDFYRELIDELLKNGIEPIATMYHWDLPQWAQDIGGWGNRDVVEWFQEYSNVLLKEFGDVVPKWITHNEPFCTSILGHGIGVDAPGHKDTAEALAVAHHVLLSHGMTVKNFRALNIKNSQIGITLNFTPAYPEDNSFGNIAAAAIFDGIANRWFLEPVFKARYPSDMENLFSHVIGNLDFVKDGDLKIISQPVDFLGVNYYTRNLIKKSDTSPFGFDMVEGNEKQTDMGWEICPDAFYELLERIKKDYTEGPIYITENGAAFKDKISRDGKVHDEDRIEYLKKHLRAALKFIENGGNLKGYYLWSLMDNFEWAFGYSKRFGITYVDYKTQKRTLKDSAYWYKNLIETRTI